MILAKSVLNRLIQNWVYDFWESVSSSAEVVDLLKNEFKLKCFDCMEYAVGRQYRAGIYIVILRYDYIKLHCLCSSRGM